MQQKKAVGGQGLAVDTPDIGGSGFSLMGSDVL